VCLIVHSRSDSDRRAALGQQQCSMQMINVSGFTASLFGLLLELSRR